MLMSDCGVIWEVSDIEYVKILKKLEANEPIALKDHNAISHGRMGVDLTKCTRERARKVLNALSLVGS
jgi:hypothetical protein